MTNIEGFGCYKVFILILYYSIQNKFVESYCSGKLYRRTLISIYEMEEIIKSFEDKKANIKDKKELSSILYYSKPFILFSKNKSETLNFSKNIYPNTVRVTFILYPPKNSGEIYYSNIDIDKLKLSEYDEREVLFLPWSSFEIENYKIIGENDYEITLNYLDKYYHQLKNKISEMREQKVIQNFCENIWDSPFSMKLVECLEDKSTIFNNIKDFLLDLSQNQEINFNDNEITQNLPPKKKFPKFNKNCLMEKINKFYSL